MFQCLYSITTVHGIHQTTPPCQNMYTSLLAKSGRWTLPGWCTASEEILKCVTTGGHTTIPWGLGSWEAVRFKKLKSEKEENRELWDDSLSFTLTNLALLTKTMCSEWIVGSFDSKIHNPLHQLLYQEVSYSLNSTYALKVKKNSFTSNHSERLFYWSCFLSSKTKSKSRSGFWVELLQNALARDSNLWK